jgi:HK97 family phage prohead protease
MPFGISQSQADCSTWATVLKEDDGSFTTIGCHASKDNAITQMVAASLTDEVEPLGEIDRSFEIEDELVDEVPELEEPEEEGEDIETRNVVSSDEVITMSELVQWIPTQQNESRSIAYSTLEFRAVGEGDTLVGYAAVFDSPSEPLPWIEFVRKGAFTKTINDGADVRLLIDHEGVPLARTKSGTLSLIEDEKGLRVEAQLDPSNPDAARVMSAMRRGDISQMSFAFRTIKDAWSPDRATRELKEVQLFDVSVVTFPAYEATVAELRAKEMNVTVPAPTSLLLRKNQLKLARHR